MALREVIREKGGPVQTFTDLLNRCVLKSTATGVEVWGEWDVQQPSGRFRTFSVRCDPETEAKILALPRLGEALDLVRTNTHPKVTP